MRVKGSGNDQCDQVADLGGNDSGATEVASVTYVAKEEHNWKRQ